MPDGFPVSRIGNWGHRLVGAYLGIRGASDVGGDITAVVRDVRAGEAPSRLSGAAAWELVYVAVFLAGVWGGLTWANGAHGFLVVVCAFTVVVFATPFFYGHAQWPKFWPLVLATACATLVWLLLPSVRSEFWRRERIA
jgi:hypothetical protein